MKYSVFFFTLLFLFFSPLKLKADTWDEPWQKEIIEQADYFILGKVTSVSSESVTVKVLEEFSRSNLPIEIVIDGFFMLRMTSTSGQPKNFNLKGDQYYYLFLKKNDKGNYSLPTPTSGFAHLDGQQYVSATYRHSYHQAVMPQDIYEFTYKNIWSHFKQKKYDKKQVNDFIDFYLSKEPAGFEDHEIEVFYHQHAALETAYLLGLTPKFNIIQKFLTSNNFHSRISALQLLGNYNNSKDAKNFLYESLTDDLYSDFEKVIAIWSLKKIGDQAIIQKAKELKDIVSDKAMGFGGNIMDPRVGTQFPSPKEALGKL
jgi:hypothetical protein